ncbi:YhfT family protein [Maledivibacter halophilus]|uniref:Transport system permease protein n=1 Tax=Maledivibacter halophilus TaxID=36842 RepID=A0A1T5M1S8_9FIRM|nr:YhfT family protein [Maledivibacter halophilus]SKC81748.1 Protein of unknown function [Maledivibacter halophilus]
MRYILIFLTGAVASMLANRGIAIFNDAVRPIIPEFKEGRMKRSELAATTFALSIGLVIGFGIPFSIMSPIILIHSLFLGTDIIGTFFHGEPSNNWLKDKKSVRGFILSGLAGGVYGLLLLIGLKWFVDGIQKLPVNVFDALGGLGDPVIFAFAAFPPLAIAFEYGYKKGIFSLGIVLLIRQIIERLGYGSPDGWALLAGFIILMLFAIKEKNESNVDTASLFVDRVKNIRKNMVWIAIMGALYGMSCNINLLMEGPQSLLALKEGLKSDAVNFSLARALSFIPLKGTTSLATGTFVTDGFGFVATVGILAPNIIIAGILGAAVISLEASSLLVFARFFDRFPGIRKAADNIRSAMSKLLEVALIVGSMLAANNIAPGVGYFVVAGLYLLNETAKRPLVKMAVGPIAAILVGIIVNILALIGLYMPAA